MTHESLCNVHVLEYFQETELAVLFPIIFNHPFPFFPLTILFLVVDIVTSIRIASVCFEDVVVRINK